MARELNLFDFDYSQKGDNEIVKVIPQNRSWENFKPSPLSSIPKSLMMLGMNYMQFNHFCILMQTFFQMGGMTAERREYAEFIEPHFASMGLIVADMFYIDNKLKDFYPSEYKEDMGMNVFIYKKFGLRSVIMAEWLFTHTEIRSNVNLKNEIVKKTFIPSILKHEKNLTLKDCLDALGECIVIDHSEYEEC